MRLLKHICILILLLNVSFFSHLYSQNKKEQIRILTAKKNSLTRVLSDLNKEISNINNLAADLEKTNNTNGNKILNCYDTVGNLNRRNHLLESKITKLKSDEFECKIQDYVRDFYNSLYWETINTAPNKYRLFLKNTQYYSKKRVNNVLDTDHYLMDLLEINKISYQDTIICVETLAEYEMYEAPSFHNKEELLLTYNGNTFQIYAWYDSKDQQGSLCSTDWYKNFNNQAEALKAIGAYPKPFK